MDHLTVGEVARELGAYPKDITNLFYIRELDDRKCPIVGGRRMIPKDYIPVVSMVLRRRGCKVNDGQTGGAR